MLLQPFFERHAFSQPAGDVDLYQALGTRLRQQPVHARSVDPKILADLRLCEAGNEVQPGGAGGELFFGVDLHLHRRGRLHATG